LSVNQFLVKCISLALYSILFRLCFLLKSRYLYFSLISSFASENSEISKGGVFDFERTSIFEIITSISQVESFGFSCHAGLGLTFQVTLITNSLLQESAISQAFLSSSGSKTI